MDNFFNLDYATKDAMMSSPGQKRVISQQQFYQAQKIYCVRLSLFKDYIYSLEIKFYLGWFATTYKFTNFEI